MGTNKMRRSSRRFSIGRPRVARRTKNNEGRFMEPIHPTISDRRGRASKIRSVSGSFDTTKSFVDKSQDLTSLGVFAPQANYIIGFS